MGAVATEQWLSVDTTGQIEKRTYESAQVRWYIKEYKRWHRIEGDFARKLIKQQAFVTREERDKYKKEEARRMLFQFYLREAQRKMR